MVLHLLHFIQVWLCFATEIMASCVATGTCSSGNAWMGEVGNKQRKRTREKYELRNTVPKVLILTGSSLCQRTVSLPRLLDQEAATRGDPVSTHISIWPFSHSEVHFFPFSLWGIQHKCSAQARLLWSSWPVGQKLLMRWAIISGSTPSLLGFPESNLLVNNRIGKRSEDRVRQPDLAAAF